MAFSATPLKPPLLPTSPSSSKSPLFPSSSRLAYSNPLSATSISFTHSPTPPPPLPSGFNSMSPPHPPLHTPIASAAAAPGDGGLESNGRGVVPPKRPAANKYPIVFFFLIWFFLNVSFNILNKKVYNYFPYPYFVSVMHLLVGVMSCLASWSVGLPKCAPMNKELFVTLVPVALCHAIGHIMLNVSVAAVAVSFTYTLKAIEPLFHISFSQFVRGNQVPVSLWQLITPVILGVSMTSLTELSFNWTGFASAMISNIAATYRCVYSVNVQRSRMDSTNVYAYISIIALIFCIPPAVLIEGPQLMQHGFSDAIGKVGLFKFLFDLFWVGIFYHLHNLLATSTLERVAPLTHVFGDVFNRVFVIGFSIMVLGNKISIWSGFGTAIAMIGFTIYTSFCAYSVEQEQSIEMLRKLGSSAYRNHRTTSLDQGE